MTEALLVSNVLLWLAVLALGALVLVLTRQIGLLHERLRPVGALDQAAEVAVGDSAPDLPLDDLAGDPLRLAGGDGARTLLFFLSPTCPVCEGLLPTLRSVAAEESPDLRLVLASDGDPEEHRRFRRRQQLEDLPYVLSTELGMRFGVARLPTAVLIDAQGVIRAKGLVNTREHLESLFTADTLGVASIQDYLERRAGRAS